MQIIRSFTVAAEPIPVPRTVAITVPRPGAISETRRLTIRATNRECEGQAVSDLLSFGYIVLEACGGENTHAAHCKIAAIREVVCEYGSRRPGAPAFQLADRLIRILNDEPATSPVTRETYRR